MSGSGARAGCRIFGEGLADRPGVDLAVRSTVASGDDGVGIAAGRGRRHRQCVAADQEIQLDQVDRPSEQGSPLGEILAEARLGLIVGR